MKIIKLVLYTILFLFCNLILFLLLSKDFRNNFFEYVSSLNHSTQLLGKTLYESIYKSDSSESLQYTETENSSLISPQKTNSKQSVKLSPKKNNVPIEAGMDKLLANNVSDSDIEEQNDPQSDHQFQIVENIVNMLSGSNGFIFIESIPEKVSVIIEGKERGKTPLTLRVNPPGIYKIVLKSENHVTWGKTVHVKPSEVTKINARLKTGSGTLTILSDPQQADIKIDGDFKGRTPLTLKSIKAGIHHIDISKGNKEYEGSFEILSEQTKIINATLKVLKAIVSVESNPKGANIFIDGINYGKTPAILKDVKIGEHQIVLVEGENLAFVDMINVYPEKENTFFAKLKDKIHFKDTFSANINVEAEFENTLVRLDGITRGKVPLSLKNLRSGEHELFLVKAIQQGTYHYSIKFFINPFESKEFSVLAKDFEYKKRQMN